MIQTIVTFWPKGYAHEDGLSMIVLPGIHTESSAGAELGKRGHSCAKIWGVQIKRRTAA